MPARCMMLDWDIPVGRYACTVHDVVLGHPCRALCLHGA